MKQQTRDMLSVGIDVGTTTTQLVFSQLTVTGGPPGEVTPLSRAAASRPIRSGIVARQVIYRGEIHFTPLAGPEEIDAAALEELVRQEYQRAGLSPGQVETGAVIVTGETAKKRNAAKILAALAALAGDFVVTVAGPHLEGVIAGRGSGAAAYSRDHYTTVVNVDIGGGSANSAIFRQGELVTAAAMNYGGRILQVDPASCRVRAVAAPAQVIIDALDLSLRVGHPASLAELRAFTDSLADLTVHLVEGTTSPLAGQLLLTPPSPVSGQGWPVFFSGGVGEYVYRPAAIRSVAEAAVYGDVGPLLAESIRQHPVISRYAIRRPAETIRATVLGASSQTVTVSGSTIWAEAGLLPQKNVPVLRLHWPAIPPGRGQVMAAVAQALRYHDLDPAGSRFALALDLAWSPDYGALTELAAGLADFAATLLASQPLLLLLPQDYGRVLGQTLNRLAPDRPLLVIDQVDLQEGDTIDLGQPILDGRVVPLSVKTLVFYH